MRETKMAVVINQEQDRATIEKTFVELMNLANNMTQEEKRYTREGFSSDEELAVYDMLFRDDLSKKELQRIKEVASELLVKIKDTIASMDHWTEKRDTQAVVDTLIRDTLLDELPECYEFDEIQKYKEKIFNHVYVRYGGVA
jgi:type I restriction enzyme R subunit